MKAFIVGTAGHIDHGKTALIRSLTGIDADRLKEEKERGITIDLGFAYLLHPDIQIGFIDVPGHERFLHNMLSGIGGVNYLLLVIAADESVMAQTREHFDICRLLGIRQGAIVLTKIDMVDEEMLAMAVEEARDLARGSFLEGAPVFPVSNQTGKGIDQLKEHLIGITGERPGLSDRQSARLNVDRIFSRKGFGTVIAGTLLSGTLVAEQEVEFLPGRISSRIRHLQSYGQDTEEVRAGRRVAANVHRVEVTRLHRGMVLAEKDSYAETIHLDVRLELLPYSYCRLKDRARIQLFIGSEETPARVILFQTRSADPGRSVIARLRLEQPVVAIHGDRFILRRFSPQETIGGGVVLHPFPPKMRRGQGLPLTADPDFPTADPENKMIRDLAWAGPAGRTSQEIGKIFGYSSEYRRECLRSLQETGRIAWPIGSEDRAIFRKHLEETRQRILLSLEEFHRVHALASGVTKEELCRKLFFTPQTDAFSQAIRELLEERQISVQEGVICLFGRRVTFTEQERALKNRLEEYYRRRGLEAPRWEEVLDDLQEEETRIRHFYQLLLKEGLLVRIHSDFTLHQEALQGAVRELMGRYAPGAVFSISEFKELLCLTRKVAIPLLEYFDRQRITRRTNDLRTLNQPDPQKKSG